jgi:hypothetical protein
MTILAPEKGSVEQRVESDDLMMSAYKLLDGDALSRYEVHQLWAEQNRLPDITGSSREAI